MKQKLKLFLNYIAAAIQPAVCNITRQEMSMFISVLIAQFTLSKQGAVAPAKAAEILNNRFKDLYLQYLLIGKKLPATVLEQLDLKVSELVIYADNEPEKLIAWVYQYLKRSDEKAAFSKVGQDKAKIEGSELLVTTQFFTDDYMVNFLVEETINSIPAEELLQTVVIDCASGGGNFLLYSFEVLFRRYRSLTSEWSDQQITDSILSRAIIGYDLDGDLSRIASLALFLKACKYAVPAKNVPINIFGGTEGDKLGFLATDVSSNTIKGKSFELLLKNLKRSKRPIVWLTNPPFMGKRDMDTGLKDELLAKFPESKADLCVAFIQRIASLMQTNHIAGFVAQNNWLYLSSLAGFRKFFLNKQHLRTCVDLGTNAFEDINGEKTNVALFVLGKPANPLTRFVELRQMTLHEKRVVLQAREYPDEVTFELNQTQFLKNKGYEFNYQLEHRFENIKRLASYSTFGNPMQGTSTGDNINFVKYAWQVNGSPDWKLVSKGGGFSKWSGLNYYKVYWGENGEKIKANKGSALRNLSKISATELVYSDTGSLGLNVRVLKPGQVFIASGPGIQVIKGLPYAHMAFLNSRVATFLLKKINPKFTISAGYIGKLPVAEGILDSREIADNSEKCFLLKDNYLAKKLPNFEFKHADYRSICDLDAYIEQQILIDLESDLRRLKLESEIEAAIYERFDFNLVEVAEIKKIVGENPFAKAKRKFGLAYDQLDQLIAGSIDVNCLSTSRKINGFAVGSESIFEDLSYKLDKHPSDLFKLAKKQISRLHLTKAKYLDDLLHKILLYELNIKQISIYKYQEAAIKDVVKKLKESYSFLSNRPSLDEKITQLIRIHHKTSFFNVPLVTFDGQHVVVGQSHNG